jgi:hypothetical protein
MTNPEIVPPSQYKAFNAMPEEVRETLYRSYIDRVVTPTKPQVTGTRPTLVPREYCAGSNFPKQLSGTLAQAWWGFDLENIAEYPATFWDALMRVPLSSLNIVVIIYERMHAIDKDLWNAIRWIRNIWVVDSAGFKCEYVNRDAMPGWYNRLSQSVCMDTKGTFQDGGGKKELLGGGQEHPGCDTWREVPRGNAEWGLHLLVGNRAMVGRSENAFTLGNLSMANRSLDEIHLDWIDPVKNREEDGYCNYSYWKSLAHLRQVEAGSGLPRSPFLVREDIARARSLIAFLKRAGVSSWADYEARCNRLDSTLGGLDLVELACKGQGGWRDLENQVGEPAAQLCADAEGAWESWMRFQK